MTSKPINSRCAGFDAYTSEACRNLQGVSGSNFCETKQAAKMGRTDDNVIDGTLGVAKSPLNSGHP